MSDAPPGGTPGPRLARLRAARFKIQRRSPGLELRAKVTRQRPRRRRRYQHAEGPESFSDMLERLVTNLRESEQWRQHRQAERLHGSVCPSPPRRTRVRARGAGRPAAVHCSSASGRGGDSGDSDPGDPESPRPSAPTAGSAKGQHSPLSLAATSVVA